MMASLDNQNLTTTERSVREALSKMRFSVAKDAADDFNRQHRVGSRVRYWPNGREGKSKVGRTSDTAFVEGALMMRAKVNIDGENHAVVLADVEAL